MAGELQVVERLELLLAGFSVEKRTDQEGEKTLIHFDVPYGPVARRYSVVFTGDGFDNFVTMLRSAQSGVEIATKVPRQQDGAILQ